MKSVIKICNMESYDDVKLIQEAVSKNSGIVAAEMSLSKKEITVIYNEVFLKLSKVIECIEDLGYIVS